MKYNFLEYKDFKDFCEKAGLTSEQALKVLEEELEKRGNEISAIARKETVNAKEYKELGREILIKNLELW